MKAAIKAIESGNFEALSNSIGQIEDINSGDKTLLYLAVEKHQIPAIQLLLEHGANPNQHAANGLAPIHIAARETEIFKLLIDHGGDIQCPDKHAKTPIFFAACHNNIEVVKLLIEKGVSPTVTCNDKRTPLHDVAERGFNEIALELLGHGADVNAENWDKVTPLHLAACYGRVEMVQLLLTHGASINAQDNSGQTPLHAAAINNHEDICKLLISSGADHTIIDKESLKAVDRAPKPLGKEITDFVIAGLMSRSRGIEITTENPGICVFCQEKKVDYVMEPCKHEALCEACYEANKSHLKFCPMCRKTLSGVARKS